MRENTLMRGREGFALPVALLAMMVIGAVVTGGFYVSSQEHNISVSTDLGTAALYAAEYGIEERLGLWRNIDLQNAVDTKEAYTFNVSNGTRNVGTYTIRVMPTANNVYMIQSEGVVTRGNRTARRRAATFVRMGTAAMPYPAAMNVIGSLEAQGNSRIRGADQCNPGTVVPGVVAPDTSKIKGGTHAGEPRIQGEPPRVQEPGMTAAALSRFGDATLEDLIASASMRLSNSDDPKNMAPVTTNIDGVATCNRNDPNNWGDPLNPDGPCADYFPVIHVSGGDGKFQLTTGVGQGILIVEGDLEIMGNFEFSGVVIVTGEFKMRGTGGSTGKINGSVLAQGQTVLEEGDNDLSGNALIEYNSCAIEKAFKSALRLKTFPSRGWLVDASPIPAL